MLPKYLGSSEANPVHKRHHKIWDKYVHSLAGGMTILTPTKGQWVNKEKVIEERMIPVDVACDLDTMIKIAEYTKKHYRQDVVFFYKISEQVYFV